MLIVAMSLFIPYPTNAEDRWGERYLFQNKQGSIKPYLVCKSNNSSYLFLIEDTDSDNLIIRVFWINSVPFDDYFVMPSFVEGYASVIRHVTRDIYDIDGEYVTMIKAPKGFWSDAYLDVSK
jgi:hypothetical protein